MAEARGCSSGRDAVALARFLDEPREAFGTRVTIAERDKNGRVIGARDAHVWHCSLSLHPEEPELADERWAEICEQFIEQMGFAGETREGAVPVGGDPPRPLRRRLRPRPPGRRRWWPRTAARPASTTTGRARRKRAGSSSSGSGCGALEARTREAGSRGAEARRARGRPPPRAAARRARRARRALEPADARADRARLRDRQPRRERVHPPAARARRPGRARATPRAAPSEVVGYSVRLPGREHGPRRSVWYGGGRLARDLTLPALRRGWRQDARRRSGARSASGGSSERRRPPLAGRAPGRARAARADVAPLHDGARARPPAAARRRHRPRRDRARRPRGRRRPRRLVARRSKASSPARSPAPARQLARSAELPAHTPAPREAALARVGAGAVHARRRASPTARSAG